MVVVLQMTGGNDYMNTVIPYTDQNYYDSRATLSVDQDDVLRVDDALGFHPTMAPIKDIYDRGDMAIIHGVGYANSPRSHFRSMDIWHTCEPDIIGTEGWVGRALRDLDPSGENPVAGVNIGQGMPRAMLVPGVSVASVADLSTYGLLTGIEQQDRRNKMLEKFVNMYGQAIGTGPVQDYLGQTGLDALKGADILKEGLSRYSSSVEYADNPIANSLRDVAMIHTADVGTRVFYTQHGSFDTHASQAPTFDKLWTEVSGAIADFWDDLREHDADENVVMFLFSEFGQACQGQRFGHRPRRGRSLHRHRPAGRRRDARRVPRDEARGAGSGRPGAASGLQGGVLHPAGRLAGARPGAHSQRALREAEVRGDQRRREVIAQPFP